MSGYQWAVVNPSAARAEAVAVSVMARNQSTVFAAGVLWTNVDAYRGASVAPRARFSELASIGSRYAGQGPAFYNLGRVRDPLPRARRAV